MEAAAVTQWTFDGELEPWTRAGQIKIRVGKEVDVRRLDMLIAHSVLGHQG